MKSQPAQHPVQPHPSLQPHVLQKEVVEVEKSDFVKSLVGENDEVEEKWAREKISLKEEMKRELVQEQLDAENKAKEQRNIGLNGQAKG